MPTVVSLFQVAAVQMRGQKCRLQCDDGHDILPYARDVYLANHAETDYVLDSVANIEHFPKPIY